ncbi:sodium/proton-translocating pyrophosphatase [Chondrinema litorale]|uniref:sodium/proton-translocating pyrophosphatase n=1 Tax=Chondrinema litorale TaxID=2994555 RepID=UPI002542C32D|nr:sodium/proton-translocating pyrophosphatase [Chondrinema litorale]UZR93609.1 sodium/proton-translocating pyrophosphatase [Chondrinema litorale]
MNEKAKVIAVFLLSLSFCLWIISDKSEILSNVFSIALLTGCFHQLTLNILGKLFSRIPDNKKFKVLLSPSQHYSAGKLMLTILQFLVLIMVLPLPIWNVENTLLLITAFLAGSTFAQIISDVFIKKPVSRFTSVQLDGERYEAFIATLISCIILGSGFLQLGNLDDNGNALNGLVLLPIIFSFINTCITYLFLCIQENKTSKNSNIGTYISLLAAGFNFYLIVKLVSILLPENFIFHGIEYNRVGIQHAMQFGLLAGLFAGLIVKLYYFTTDKYISFLLKQTSSNTLVNTFGRIIINGIIYLIPVISVFMALWYSFKLIGLYGLAISFLGMLSNVGLKLFIQHDKLEFRKTVRGFSQFQLIKLQLVSPDVVTYLQQLRQSLYFGNRKSASK